MNSVAAVQIDNAGPVQKKAIRFPARSFLAFALAPEAPLSVWLESLDQWTEASPGFFSGRPVVLDLNQLNPTPDEIESLVAELGERGIRVYAIEANGLESLAPTLPPLLKGARAAAIEEAQDDKEVEDAEPPVAGSTTLLVEAPVRSGQSIYHPEGDVVVLGSVASGSEIVAGGSIHIYGTLRGRAHAGATGNAQARIFCRRNEAELLAIDGWYRTAEDMDASIVGKPVQAVLEQDVVWVAALK